MSVSAFKNVYLPWHYSGNPEVNDDSNRGANWKRPGPDRVINDIPNATSHEGGTFPKVGLEDTFMWQDPRGNYHALFHSFIKGAVGGHAFRCAAPISDQSAVQTPRLRAGTGLASARAALSWTRQFLTDGSLHTSAVMGLRGSSPTKRTVSCRTARTI